MEAQKDLLRQDASAAVASLENELASAIGAHEACKQELAGVESRAAKLTKDLHIAEGDVDTLERTRDRLTAERDEQATRLDALESAQEQSERDVDELQEALSVATRCCSQMPGGAARHTVPMSWYSFGRFESATASLPSSLRSCALLFTSFSLPLSRSRRSHGRLLVAVFP